MEFLFNFAVLFSTKQYSQSFHFDISETTSRVFFLEDFRLIRVKVCHILLESDSSVVSKFPIKCSFSGLLHKSWVSLPQVEPTASYILRVYPTRPHPFILSQEDEYGYPQPINVALMPVLNIIRPLSAKTYPMELSQL